MALPPSPADDAPLPAGTFSAWLGTLREAIAGRTDSDVPCDGCTACCTASQFIRIGPDEADTLAHIPPALLFPAPRQPKGHVLMGYDEQGRCPMLVKGACSIYEHRPRTCRTYDCRVFAAAGVELPDPEKAGIAERARRWVFDFPTDLDRREHDAVVAAATHLAGPAGEGGTHGLPEAERPANATQLAVRAVERYEEFLA